MPYPNFKNKYREKALFNPTDFLSYLKSINRYPQFKPPAGMIFCYSESLLNQILKTHPSRKVCGFHGEIYLLAETGEKVGVAAKFGFGASNVATLMEELIAFGVKKFLSIGDAGALQKDLKMGSLIVCEKAIRDEGASHHYLKPGKYASASPQMLKKIIKTLQKLNFPYRAGKSWTIDAPYRETLAEIKHYRKAGVLSVEMEAAAVFAVAQYRKVEAGAIFTISDYLSELEWQPKFHLTRQGQEKLFTLAKEVLLDT